METSFKQTTSNKVERYRLFLPQFELLISDEKEEISVLANTCLLYTSPSPRDRQKSRMPSSA